MDDDVLKKLYHGDIHILYTEVKNKERFVCDIFLVNTNSMSCRYFNVLFRLFNARTLNCTTTFTGVEQVVRYEKRLNRCDLIRV
jgi:hypothetical protein